MGRFSDRNRPLLTARVAGWATKVSASDNIGLNNNRRSLLARSMMTLLLVQCGALACRWQRERQAKGWPVLRRSAGRLRRTHASPRRACRSRWSGGRGGPATLHVHLRQDGAELSSGHRGPLFSDRHVLDLQDGFLPCIRVAASVQHNERTGLYLSDVVAGLHDTPS